MSKALDRPLLRHLAHVAARVTRGMTLGVRGIALDPEGRVCLVRHTYVEGWYLPGGGVEPGETLAAAMVREFREETGIRVTSEASLRLHGLYLNRIHGGRDHVAVFVAGPFVPGDGKRPDREIAECRYFPLDALPLGTTRGTRARLIEFAADAVPGGEW